MSTQDFGDQVFLWLARDVRVDRIQDELLQFRRLSRLRVDVVPDDPDDCTSVGVVDLAFDCFGQTSGDLFVLSTLTTIYSLSL